MGFSAKPRLRGGGPIVMVDDNDADAMVARIYHRKAGLEQSFIHLESGESLLAHLDDATLPTPSIVMLDINMRGIDGFETLGLLRERSDELPVIVMVTSSKSEADQARAEELGADGYFVKPLEGTGYLEFFREISGA